MAAPSRKDFLSQDYLQECFDYNPETGECLWAERPSHHFKSEQYRKRFLRSKTGRKVGCRINSGSSEGYTIVKLKGKCWYLHRLIYTLMTGEQPFNIDHANLNREDNRWSNLRNANLSENCTNVKGRGMSGFKGVYIGKYGFRSVIHKNNKKIEIGTFSSAKDAAIAYDEAAKKHHGEFAVLNFKERL